MAVAGINRPPAVLRSPFSGDRTMSRSPVRRISPALPVAFAVRGLRGFAVLGDLAPDEAGVSFSERASERPLVDLGIVSSSLPATDAGTIPRRCELER